MSRVALLFPVAILLGPGACQDHKHWVPARVREVVTAYCEKDLECYRGSFYDYYDSVEDCVDINTKYYPWDKYSEACTEAWIGYYECFSRPPCNSDTDCTLQVDLRSYHCWRFDTAADGQMCSDASTVSSSDCDEACNMSGGEYPEWVLCSAQTSDYCNCGPEHCAEGEFCCVCRFDYYL